MKEKVYDSRTPHPKCRVLPVPSPKVHGLSMSQASARRRVEYIGVLKPHMAGGPVGLGIKSTVSITPRMLKATPWHHGPRTPGCKGPRSPKPPKQNPCFYKPIAKGRARDFQHEAMKLRELNRIHILILQNRVGVNVEESYEAKRRNFLRLYPNSAYKVREFEQHNSRVVKPVR
jgi:hypothetical protein